MMIELDENYCVTMLHSITNGIAETFERPGPDFTIADFVRRIQALNRLAVNEMRDALSSRLQHIGWSNAEEANAQAQTQPETSDAYWVYDPIDAAYHLAQGLPLWSSSLALVVNGRTELGIVYDPVLKETFVARRGCGAILNGVPLQPAGKKELRGAVVATFLPPYGHGDPSRHAMTLQLISAVAPHVFVIRQMASASLHLAYVAAGRLDALFEVGSTIHDWLAGSLLVEEVGFRVTDLEGRPFGWTGEGILAAAPAISDSMTAITGAVHRSRDSTVIRKA
jgi:myo-inositol-1(or 4)-monophosphatase